MATSARAEAMEEVEGSSTRKKARGMATVAFAAALLRYEVPGLTIFVTCETEYISILGSLPQNAEGERAEVNRPLKPHPSA